MEHVQQSQSWTQPSPYDQASNTRSGFWQADAVSLMGSQTSSKRGFGIAFDNSHKIAAPGEISRPASGQDTSHGGQAEQQSAPGSRELSQHHGTLTPSSCANCSPNSSKHLHSHATTQPQSAASIFGGPVDGSERVPMGEMHTTSSQQHVNASASEPAATAPDQHRLHTPDSKMLPWQSNATVHSNAVFTSSANTPDAVRQLQQQLRQVRCAQSIPSLPG